MPDLLLVDHEAAAGLSGRRDAEGFVFRRHDIVTRVGGEGKGLLASFAALDRCSAGPAHFVLDTAGIGVVGYEHDSH
jgi:hypothetical protein